MFAALFTGALISLSGGAITWPFLALYGVAVILVATLVAPKGLFLNIASAPLLFFAAVAATGYVMSKDAIAAGGSSGKAALLFVLYPVAEFFPVLFTVTVGSILIAVVRIWLIERRNKAIARYETSERTRQQASNRRTTSQSRRARERTQSVPVHELLERAKTERKRGRNDGGSTRVVTRLGDDLYKG